MSDTPDTPETEKTLGKYRILRELGKGAMGVVYLGHDPDLERDVALKQMASAIVSDQDLKERFEREAKAVGRLQHPNIVTVFDLGYDAQGAPFIAMEYLKGQDLEQRIRRNPLTFKEKLDVVAQTCRGLSHAHKADIVHRDIKPANIFISESGEAKIMDFGVARWAKSSHTQTGAVLGTADYMSPEQIRGQKVDGRSDIFSVGVILYRLLTNKKPFSGENIQAVFFKVLNQDAPELVLPDGTEMPELQAIVDKALSKTPEERYETADDLADDISDLMRLYQDVLNENTVFDTMFDPAAAVDETGSDGSGRRRASSTGSGRILGSTTSGSRTGRPGTSYPTGPGRTAPGRTVPGRTMPGRTAVGATRMGRAGGTMVERGSVGIPVQDSGSSVLKYVGLAIVMIALGGGIYWFTRTPPGPQANAGAATSTPVDLAGRFAFAESALENRQFSQAMDAVETILTIEPTNQRAIDLKDEINRRLEESAPGQPAPAPVPAAGPSRGEQAKSLEADAYRAISNGQFAAAERHIREGRGVDPNNAAWAELTRELQKARQGAIDAQANKERQAIVQKALADASAHIQAQNYPAAIAVYDAALTQDPSSTQLIAARQTAQGLLDLEAQKAAAAAAAVARLNIVDSGTEYIAPGNSNAPRGFESGGVKVNRATKGPDNPGELIVEILPQTVKPGDPYFLRVRVSNPGNKPIGIKSLELVSMYGSKTSGRGMPLTPKVQRINPRDVSMIFEAGGTWTEDQNKGSIVATVTLIGDAKLRKKIEW